GDPVCNMPPTQPARTAAAGVLPKTDTVPVSGLVRPSIMSIVVVLPAPFGPSMATVSPEAIFRSIERTPRTSPQDFESWARTIPPARALPLAIATRVAWHGPGRIVLCLTSLA